VRKDLPLLVERLQHAHPDVEWLLRRTVGEDEAVIAAMAQCALQPSRSEQENL
jgi:sirohydrochlorin ferrochelatase